jgi:hypothetical protein
MVTFAIIWTMSFLIIWYILYDRFHVPHYMAGECYTSEPVDKEKWERPSLLDVIKIEEVGKKNYSFRLYVEYNHEYAWNLQMAEFFTIESYYKQKVNCPL